MKKHVLIILSISLLLSSCRVFNPTKMLRMGAFPEYSNLDDIKDDQMYKIAPFDNVSFSIIPNDGEGMISTSAAQKNSLISGGGGGYLVEFDGTIKLPIFGRTPVEGLTTRELETLLEEKYSLFYNKPFVANLNVTNRKVFVFRNNNNSSVVNLTQEKMTVWELIAQTGGVGDSKSHRIKLIRQIDGVPHIFLIDLFCYQIKSTFHQKFIITAKIRTI